MRSYQRVIVLTVAICLLAPSIVQATTSPEEKAQQKSDAQNTSMPMSVPSWLVGTWTLVRCDNVYPDGHHIALYGPNPQGAWMVDAGGRYLMHIARAQLISLASADKSKGPAQDYSAPLDRNAYFGSVSIMGNSIKTHVEQASFSNGNGRDGVSDYALNGNLLTYIESKPISGAAVAVHGEWLWRKVD